jgi:hypothetical protein
MTLSIRKAFRITRVFGYYQATRPFNSSELSIISDDFLRFTNSWAAHGIPLNAGFDIRFNQFVILAADEYVQQASGCSIDDSVRKVKELEGNDRCGSF